MNSVLAEPVTNSVWNEVVETPCFSLSPQPTVLSDIYQPGINIAAWQRQFEQNFVDSVAQYVEANPTLNKSLTVTPDSALADLEYATEGLAPKELLENMAQLVDMFCCLFDLDQVGLRFATLSAAMCPRFHTDQVPCRLVTTYQGAATEWLPNPVLDRTKLGLGSNGQPDALSGLYQADSDMQRLKCGDVALLKGGKWEGNEQTALVHRSPSISSDKPRLIMTLDFG